MSESTTMHRRAALRSETAQRREAARVEHRGAIQQAMRQLLADRPPERVRMDEVAAAIDVSVGTIYTHFLSKDDLLLSLLEDGAGAASPPGEAEWAALLRLASPGCDRISGESLAAADSYVTRNRLGSAFVSRLSERIDSRAA